MQGFFQGISFQLAKVGVGLALLVGFLMSAIQIYIDYHSQVVQVNRMIERVIRVAKPPAEKAVLSLDSELAEEVAIGLMQYEYIVDVALIDELGDELTRQTREPSDSNTVWITELITDRYRRIEEPLRVPLGDDVAGVIVCTLDMDAAFVPFYRNSALSIAVGFVRSSILVICLFFAFFFLITKPLIRLTEEMKKINPGSPGEQRIDLDKVSPRKDELRQLVKSANQLLDAVDVALAKRLAAEVVLRKSEEHVRQIIDSLPVWVGARNSDGHYIFANKALADFLQTSSQDMRGSHLAEFNEFFVSDTSDMVRLDADVIGSGKRAQIWEERWISQAGEELHMHTHVMPMDFYDETVALIVSSDITELKATQELMQHMAYHDALTDLPNRSYLIERLEEEVKKASKRNEFGALLFIDLDQFKNINDSLGHPVGDGMLKHVANRLLETVSEADIVVRLGGDEFVVVLTELGSEMASAILRAEDAAERIRRSTSDAYYYSDLELRVTCSVGIVMFPEEGVSVHELLRFADTAMYQVKEQGRDAIQFFNKSMAEQAKNILVMEGDLHKALDQNRFALHFQPRVDISNATIVGAEALLRWTHPDKGVISPLEFIPILETSGLIVDVGLWVLEKSMRQTLVWRDAGLWGPSMRIGVNISPRQIRSSSFVSDVAALLDKLAFPGSMLELEITESIAIQNLEVTLEKMSQLRDLGVVFALDDFGTGYSSISYLKRLPFSVLKIDKSFVRDINEDRNDRVLVQMITAMANLMELEVVAEGVETKEQLALLNDYQCQFYQGYLCSRPVEEDEFTHLLGQALLVS